MKDRSITLFSFLLGLTAFKLQMHFFPSMHLMIFAPFLAIVYMRCSLISSLWLSFLCGLIIDLLSSEMHFGLNALNYALLTIILYAQKKHFFFEKASALFFYTLLISLFSSLFQILFALVFRPKFPFHVQLIIQGTFLMSIIDAIYAFLWFTLPLRFFLRKRKILV